MRTLVLGGIRSGKSRWAESAIAESTGAGQPVHYLATGASPEGDPDWSARIAAHRARRPSHWSTVETIDIPTQLRSKIATPTLVDDIGGWLTAMMDRRGAWAMGSVGSVTADVDDLIDAVGAFPSPLALVSPGQPQPAAGRAVRPGGARGRRPAVDREGAQPRGVPAVTEFPSITPPDPEVAAAARTRQDRLTKPPGSLGRLEDLSVWVASCQGVCPPRQFQRPRVVVFAGDHGVTAAGVSAYPAEVTAQMVANFDAGGAAINVLAEAAGASVRVVDIAVDAPEPLSPSIGAHKVRRGSGNIAVEDALSADEAAAAIQAGRQIADEEVDSGADLLIAGDMGIGNTTAATTLIAALTGSEPVAVVGRGTGIDDAGWARKTAAIRDALYRARALSADPIGLLRVCGGADLAAMAGFCAQAAVRRMPLLLDGVVVTAAALVAERLAPGARQWWQAGHRSTEPAHALALGQLELEPIIDMRMRLGEGTGAAVALPIVRAAVAALASMATFDEAGVTA